MGFLVRDGVAVVAMMATAWAAGRAVVGWMEGDAAAAPTAGATAASGWRLRLDGGVETAAVSISLGLVVLGYAGLGLGLLGWLRPGPIAMAGAGIAAASWSGWRRVGGEMAAAAARVRGARWGWLGLAMGCAAVAPFVVLALYPPTAFDATSYHLPYARAFVATGGLPFLPGLRYPIFPQMQEVLFALLMAFAGDEATHFVSLAATGLTVALLVVWGRRSRAGGWVAAAAYAGCPIVVYLGTTAYIEAGLVLCSTAALYAVVRWRAGGGEGWLTLAAVFGGAAADSKYLGLFSLAVVGAAAVALRPATEGCIGGPGASDGGRWRLWAGRVLRVGIVGVAAIAPWYGRIVAATGNPVFPFLPEVFGESPWVAREFHSLRGALPRLGELALGLLRTPWDAVMARRRLGGYPPYSPVFLLAPLALVPAAWFDRRVRGLLATAVVYGFVVFAFLPDGRYLLLALPLVAVALGETVVWLLAAWARRRRRDAGWVRRAAAWVAALLFLPGWLYAGFRIQLSGPLPLTPAGRQAFLARQLPVYPALRYLNQECGDSYTVYALHAENMLYFAAGRFLGDWSGPAAYRIVMPADGDAAELYRRLRALGADHLLTVEHDAQAPPLDTAAFRARFRQVYADGGARVFALAGTRCR